MYDFSVFIYMQYLTSIFFKALLYFVDYLRGYTLKIIANCPYIPGIDRPVALESGFIKNSE